MSETPEVDAAIIAVYGQPESRQFEAIIAISRRLESERDAAREALRELVEAGDEFVTSTDDVASMLRFGEAYDRARAILEAKP